MGVYLGPYAKSLEKVLLAQYGSLEQSQIECTLAKALDDIDGKCLILPDMPIDLGDVRISDKVNFAIRGNKKYPITCKDFCVRDCSNFELSNLFVKGVKHKFATFCVIGNCSGFSIHNCLFDSEKGVDGHNQFYGIHVIADSQKPNATYENSPRHFRIYNNVVKNTRYDGILAHAHCSDFVIEKNTIIGAECIGIEIEGRYGDSKTTTVHPCKNAIIRNNLMHDCKEGWNILVMWTDGVKICRNRCYNGFGSFLSVGCTNLKVKSNYLEGRVYGFELSNEFYKIENGFNDHVLIKNNIIIGKSRSAERGVIDVCHSMNVMVKKNKIKSIFRDKSAMISVASSKHVTINKNKFVGGDKRLYYAILINNVPDYETKEYVSNLDIEDVEISNNTFVGNDMSIESNGISLSQVNCVIKCNKFKWK